MTDFTVTNAGNVTGTTGIDRLTYIYNTTTNDVWLLSVSGSLATGYSGVFNGMGANDCSFTGIENFTFIDQSGGNDDIHTGDGDDVLDGGAGNDVLFGNGGIDTILGGSGNDLWGGRFASTATAFTINLNVASSFLGSGSVTGCEGMDLVTGSGKDAITTHRTAAMNDSIDTGANADKITVYMGGTDAVAGGAGNDLLIVYYEIATNDVFLSNLAHDPNGGYTGTFNGLGSNDLFFTGIERFQFTDRSGGNDIINTGNGNDVLNGGGGNDVLKGGGGIDRIIGGAGIDVAGLDLSKATDAITIDLNGDSTFLGNGLIRGIEGLEITTGSGNDQITGHATSAVGDVINTGAGDDTITLTAGGSDSVNGGNGLDTLVFTYTGPTNGVFVASFGIDGAQSGYTGNFDGLGASDVLFAGIDRFVFTDQSGGNDVITTGDGDDILNGGGGDDTLNSGGGNDQINGGGGKDIWIADHAAATQSITIDLNAESTFLTGGKVKNVEALSLTTGSGYDTVTTHRTSAMADTISTGEGDDRINLYAGGSDTVNASWGSDTLSLTYEIASSGVFLTDLAVDNANGGYTGHFDGLAENDVTFLGVERFEFNDLSGGDDIIRTGNGNDVLKGGGGMDELSGGGGADTINGGADLDFITGGRGNDTLRGGTESDTFVYNRAVNENSDTILDFQDGIDHIKIAGGSFAALSITAINASDLRIDLSSGTSITLMNLTLGQLAADDFIFF